MFTWGDDDDFVGELCTWGDDNAFVSITVTGKWFCRWGVYLGRQWWGTAGGWNNQCHTATSLSGCASGWGSFSWLYDGVSALSQFTAFRPNNAHTICVCCRVSSFDSDGQFPGGEKRRKKIRQIFLLVEPLSQRWFGLENVIASMTAVGHWLYRWGVYLGDNDEEQVYSCLACLI